MRNKKLLYIFPLVWMGVIFYFSHQPVLESSQMSGWLADSLEAVIRTLNLNTSDLNLHLLIRKAAHLTEFAILGLLLFKAVYPTVKKLLFSSVITVVIGAAYGIIDELHQLFIEGRSCQITDMMIDAGGVLLAVLLSSCCVLMRNHIYQQRNKQDHAI